MPEFIMQLAVKASGPKPVESVKQLAYSRGRPPTDTESAQGVLWVLDEKATSTLAPQEPETVNSEPRKFDPQFLSAVELFCASDLSFDAAQRAVMPQPQIEPQKAAFLAELTELSRKYQFIISGCGCCGSPYLMKLEASELVGKYTVDGDDLSWEE